MPKKVKFILLFISVFAGVALIAGNQAWAQSDCENAGSFQQAVFDVGDIKIVYNSCTGEVITPCYRCSTGENCGAEPCGAGYEPGTQKVLYLKPNPTLYPDDIRLITNVGPGTGCVCYGSCPCCVGGRCWSYTPTCCTTTCPTHSCCR